MNARYLIPVFALIVLFGAVTLMDDSDAAVVNPSNSTLVGDLYYAVSDNTASVVGVGGTGYTSITIPDTVEINGATYDVVSIGDNIFSMMMSLTTVSIGNNVKSVGNGVFATCYALESVTFGESVETIGRSIFQDCRALKSITIPDSVTSIGDSAFLRCSALESVVLSNSIQIIPMDCFSMCTNLKDIRLPNSVVSLKQGAFSACDSLTTLVLPSSLSSIGYSAMPPYLKEVLNLSSLNIRPGYDGLRYNTVVRTGESGVDSLTMLQEVGEPEWNETIQTPVEGPIPIVLSLIPILLFIAMAIGVVAFFKFRN